VTADEITLAICYPTARIAYSVSHRSEKPDSPKQAVSGVRRSEFVRPQISSTIGARAKRRRAPTLASIAAQLDVHVSTVSRVLNGNDEAAAKAASPDVISRIRALATKLDYRPNIQARQLKAQTTQEIGVLVPRLSDFVLATVYEGIDEVADQFGFMTFVSNTEDDPARQQERAERALYRQVAGLIIADTHLGRHQPLLDKLSRTQTPYILVYRRQPGHVSVSCNERKGGRLVAQHLFERGFRDVAVLAGPTHASTGVDRTRGFVEFYREQGIEIDRERVLNGPFDAQAGRELGESLLRSRRKPEAVFAVNDFLAIGLMGALRDGGLIVGRDIALVGYNDTPLAAELPIPLTSIRVPLKQMGRMAVELLLARMEWRPVNSAVVQPELIVRASSLL
jgi:LacI family transcriptional regulator